MFIDAFVMKSIQKKEAITRFKINTFKERDGKIIVDIF